MFAENYEDDERDTSLRRIEKILTDMTEEEFDIAPGKRELIDSLFAGADKDKRVEIAAQIIQNDDTVAQLLPLYDAKLYDSACDYLRANARRKAVEAAQDKVQAENALSEAATQLARATVAASRAS